MDTSQAQKPFVVYNASAGSGKTFTLVKEYLKCCLKSTQPNAYRHILAVTFTNKAAAEMKQRVLHTLSAFASEMPTGVEGSMMALIREETGMDAASIRQASIDLLEQILHDYSAFSISTIDKFTHRIIRTFAYDLHLPMNFEVEMDGDRLLSEAVDLLISHVGKDEDLTRMLVAFTESKVDDNQKTSWDIETDLSQMARFLLKEDSYTHIDRLSKLSVADFFDIRDTLYKEKMAFEGRLKSIGDQALDLIAAKGIAHKSFPYGDLPNHFLKHSKGKIADIAFDGRLAKNLEADKWYTAAVAEDQKMAIEEIKETLLALYEESQAYIEQGKADYILYTLIIRNLYALSVLNEIEKRIHEIKEQQHLLHISEFNKAIAAIVKEQPAPFIYERIGERYRNYFIDEFQDTSVLQWQNLWPLIENAVSREGGSCMLVGDGKQAIYRWRGGKVEQFIQLSNPEDKSNKVRIGDRLHTRFEREIKTLDTNWRSRSAIISFNNEFFEQAAQKLLYPEYQQLFRSSAQKSTHKEGGYIQIRFLDNDVERYEEENCKQTLERIQSLLQEGYRLKDIAILIRRNAQGSLLANYLNAEGIRVVSPESMLLSHSAAVNFIVTTYRFIHQPADYSARVAMLEYLISQNKIQTDEESKHDLFARYARAPQEQFIAFLAEKGFLLKPAYFLQLSVYESIEELIRVFALNPRKDPYLQAFMDAVLDYSHQTRSNHKSFPEWWEQEKEKRSIVLPEALDAVKIMSIHKSKGLEFPVVIFPFANWNSESDQRPQEWIELDLPVAADFDTALIPINKDLQEAADPYRKQYEDHKSRVQLDNLNLLYVALTRPEERLYVLTSPRERQRNLSDYFTTYLKYKGLWSEGQTTYDFGTPDPPEKGGDAPDLFAIEEVDTSTDWRNKIAISKQAPLRWDVEAPESLAEKGTLMHKVLAQVHTIEDIDPALDTLRLSGMADEAQQIQIEQTLRALFRVAELKPYFDAGIKARNEAEILLSTGQIVRPDRVVFHTSGLLSVLDYKTGSPQKKHKEQLDGYAEALSELGYEPIEKVLIYLGEPFHVEKWSGKGS